MNDSERVSQESVRVLPEGLDAGQRLNWVANVLLETDPGTGEETWRDKTYAQMGALTADGVQTNLGRIFVEAVEEYQRRSFPQFLTGLREGEARGEDAATLTASRDYYEPTLLRLLEKHLEFTAADPTHSLFSTDELRAVHDYFEARSEELPQELNKWYADLREDLAAAVEELPEADPEVVVGRETVNMAEEWRVAPTFADILEKYAPFERNDSLLALVSSSQLERDAMKIAGMTDVATQEEIQTVLGALQTFGAKVEAAKQAVRERRGSADTDYTWQQIVSIMKEEKVYLGLEVEESERRANFIAWIRDEAFKVLSRKELSGAHLDSEISIATGVFSLRYTQILKLLPREMRDLEDKIIDEFEFYTAWLFRAHAIRNNEVWGDLDAQVKALGKFGTSDAIVMDAAKWDSVNEFAGEVDRSLSGRAEPTKGMEMGETYGDHLKKAFAAYGLLTEIWQDGIAGESKDNRPKIGDKMPGARGEAFLESLKDKGWYTREELAWLTEAETNIFYVPNVSKAQQNYVRAKIAIWAGGGDPKRLSSLSAAEKEFLRRNRDLEKLVPAGSGETKRRVAIWKTWQYQGESLGQDFSELIEAWHKGKLVEMVANYAMWAGGEASFLDINGEGDSGLNKALQFMRFTAGQRFTGRRGPNFGALQKIEGLSLPYTELVKLKGKKGKEEKKESLRLWFMDPNKRYEQIPFLEGMPTDPDKKVAGSFLFASLVFHLLQRDQPLSIGDIVAPVKGATSGQDITFDPKELNNFWDLWKYARLAFVIPDIKNSVDEIRRTGMIRTPKGPLPEYASFKEGREQDSPKGLAREILRILLVQIFSYSYPQTGWQRLGLPGILGGPGYTYEAKPASYTDELTLVRFVDKKWRIYPEGDRLTGEPGKESYPLFSRGEIYDMFKEAGRGGSAQTWIRRNLGGSPEAAT